MIHLLPHRPPMLLLDEVRSMIPGERIVARTAITADGPWHTPHGFPPHLLLESWLQAACVLAGNGRPGPGPDVVVAGVRDVVVRRRAHAGEIIEHHVALVRRLDDAALCTGTAVVVAAHPDADVVVTVGQVVLGFLPPSGGV